MNTWILRTPIDKLERDSNVDVGFMRDAIDMPPDVAQVRTT